MESSERLCFGPFRLGVAHEQLWREDQPIPIRPKTFAVLRHLATHAGQLVTQEELLDTVWAKTIVTDTVLRSCIRELRSALGDDARQPRYIATVHRRGYRFVAAVAAAPVSSSTFKVPSSPPPALESTQTVPVSSQPGTWNLKPETVLVGRETELTFLHRLLDNAWNGERQIVFVTGEPGIGKTTLVEAFLGETRDWRLETSSSAPQASSLKPLAPSFWLGRGQCVEQHGAGEAYLPVLEALGRMGREPGGEQFVATLHQYAPTWLVQMPALVGAEELEALQRRVLGATRERMLREMVEAIEALAVQRPVVLWLEDLHWADSSTVDWLAAIAQRSAPARVLVIGTYRPSDLRLSNHPLRAVTQELVAKAQCEELRLPFLTTDDVTHYLTQRYNHHQFPSGLGTAIHQRTDGNPLFVVNMVEYLAVQGVIAKVAGQWHLQTTIDEVGHGVPDSVRQLIEKHIERLSEGQQQLLEVASVAGVTFSATAVAAVTETSVEQVEASCDGLVKRSQFLQAQEPRVLPDGTLCAGYGFQHALQQAVLYERLPSLRRVRLHRRVGDSEEQNYGERAHEIASELAVHFERGSELHRAVQYRQHAGHNALRQHGYQEAITHFTRGLELLATFPDTAERTQQELALLVALGLPLQMTKGYAAPEVADAYGRARELCQQIGEQVELFPTLIGLSTFYLVRAELQTARELGEQCVRLAQQAQDPALHVTARFTLGVTLFFRGELAAAHAALEQGSDFYDRQEHSSLASRYGHDPGVVCQGYDVLALWSLGYPDRALRKLHEALTLARELSHAFSTAIALHTATWLHQYRQERQAVKAYAEEKTTLCQQEGFTLWGAVGAIQHGWALSQQGDNGEGLMQMRSALTTYNATGAALAQPYHLGLLAQVYGHRGQVSEGLTLLDEALATVNQTGERYYEAELYRLKGQLTLEARGWRLETSPSSTQASSLKPLASRAMAQEAEECFLKALDIARQQQAKSLELRAAMSLARLWQHRGNRREAHTLLSTIYSWFTEGFGTADLQEATRLLKELAGR